MAQDPEGKFLLFPAYVSTLSADALRIALFPNPYPLSLIPICFLLTAYWFLALLFALCFLSVVCCPVVCSPVVLLAND